VAVVEAFDARAAGNPGQAAKRLVAVAIHLAARDADVGSTDAAYRALGLLPALDAGPGLGNAERTFRWALDLGAINDAHVSDADLRIHAMGILDAREAASIGAVTGVAMLPFLAVSIRGATGDAGIPAAHGPDGAIRVAEALYTGLGNRVAMGSFGSGCAVLGGCADDQALSVLAALSITAMVVVQAIDAEPVGQGVGLAVCAVRAVPIRSTPRFASLVHADLAHGAGA
jgi:hypothetical protein